MTFSGYTEIVMTSTPQEAPVATNPITHPLEAAKAYVALVGTIATALLAVYGPETEVGQWLTVLAVVATAVATFAVPNAAARDTAGVHYDGHGGV